MSFVAILERRARLTAGRIAYRFLDGDDRELTISYGELDRRARGIAAELRRRTSPGERAVLVYPPGLEFVAAFFGCLYAGVIAVPSYPPDPGRLERGLARLVGIVADAKPVVALVTAAVRDFASALTGAAPELAALPWIATDEIDEGDDDFESPATDALAFLQYTSGSTTEPRGVMVSHENLVHNVAAIHRLGRATPESVFVSWLPAFHDMGLIGGVLTPLFGGFAGVLMSPLSFLQRPLRWLAAISRHRGTISPFPNFALELCLAKIGADERLGLDLSCWDVACNGAEPIRADTLRRFSDAFAAAGFRHAAHYPSYGLAEATLIVTGADVRRDPTLRRYDLRGGRAVPSDVAPELVGCGVPLVDQAVAIVVEGARQGEREIGEIWIAGPSVARGYFGREATEFGARLPGDSRAYVRTGDLGFLDGGELFVAGRLKDVLIVDGENRHPQDLERTVERCHAAIRTGCCAAFGIDVAGAERIAIAAEVRGDAPDVPRAIRRAIADEHGVSVHAVVVLRPGALPKTSSGKLQRGRCRALFEGGWPDADVITSDRDRAPDVRAWLEAAVLREAPGVRIDRDEPFASFGLGSRQLVGLAGELGTWLGRSLPPTLCYEHPTIDAVARFVAGEPLPGPRAAAAPTGDAIAIVGLACRFPGAPDEAAYWRLLEGGVDAITEVPADRWDAAALYDPDPASPGKVCTRWGGFVEGIDLFDAAFFRISPGEAARLDPQQRLLLELAWEAFEDAGIVPATLARSDAGVFAGLTGSEYGLLQIGDVAGVDGYAGTGSATSIAANRISYVFDLRGPSLAIDTACSSSLAAVHLACESLRRGDCSLALAGGASLLLAPSITASLSRGNFMARDGRCKAFDARADGYVRGEGAGLVVLKPLAAALADGDPIRAVIRGSAMNQDGRTNGLTAPSREAQEAVVREALRRAGVAPADVGYVEAHGTGTALGDPIEVRAIGAVLGPRATPCPIGSVKTNIGHLEAAAGIAGLVKVVLSLEHGVIPPSLHCRQPSPLIPWDELPVRVQREAARWPGGERIAGVSAFGFGGTNVHVVVAARPPMLDAPARPERAELLAISAPDPRAALALASTYATRIADADVALADLCATAGLRRTHHAHRIAVVGSSAAALATALRTATPGDIAPGGIAFVFPGHGGQWPGMGRGLYRDERRFREVLDACDRAVRAEAGFSIVEALHGAPRTMDVVQPLIFALEVGLAELLASWGVRPDFAIGHSMGEVAAAHVAGALTLEDAVRVICRRSALLLRVAGRGAMAAVGLSFEEASRLARAQTSVAASNGPSTSVLAGEPGAIDRLVDELGARGIFARRLQVDVASHGPQVDTLLPELSQALGDVRARAPTVPIASTVTGRIDADPKLDAAYWGRNLREPVRFHEAVQAVADRGARVFVELGPHPTLLQAIGETVRDAVLVPTLGRDEDDRAAMLGAIARLHVAGASVDFRAIHAPPRTRVALPAHPWQRARHWLASSASASAPHAVLGRELGGAGGGRRWERRHDAAASLVDLALAASDRLGGRAIEDFAIESPPPDAPRSFQVLVASDGGIEILGRGDEEPWILHARARLA